MPPAHREIISHICSRLEKHGVASFAEINAAAGIVVLNRGNLSVPSNPTARWVARVLNSGSHIALPMPIRGSTRAGSRGSMPKHTLYLVEAELEPVLKYAQATARSGRGEFHPAISALFRAVDGLGPGSYTLISDRSSKGVPELVKAGFLEEAPFAHGERPKGLHWSLKRFKATDPALLLRAAIAARRVIALQRGED